MPNWCEGQLKIKGTIRQISAFVKAAFDERQYEINIDTPTNIDITLEKNAWIKGSRRAFCDGYVVVDTQSETEKRVAVLDFRQAWDVESDTLLKLAKKTHVDIRLYAFEQGMEFNRNIEIINGELTKDEDITFDNYEWDCPCPLIGG